MERRKFLRNATIATAAGAATAGASGSALAQSTAKWRMLTMWPRSLDTLFGSADQLGKRVTAISGGQFDLRAFPAGEIAPPGQILDAVSMGTVECGHVLSSFFTGKNPAFAFDAGLAFGLNTRQQNAWMYHGGGLEAMRSVFAKYNVVPIPCGNVGVQMGGWYRKEIKSVEDLKGLKFRVGGFAGRVLERLGVVPQNIPGGEIYPALEKGTIDAAEWVGPYDDLKLGFYKVAKNYYYPGFWEGGPQLSIYLNAKTWEALPADLKAIVEAAASHAHVDMQARYDALNPQALRKLIAEGTRVAALPRDVLQASFKAAHEVYAEVSAKNQNWNKMWADYSRFRGEQYQWFNYAERSYDNFMFSQKL